MKRGETDQTIIVGDVLHVLKDLPNASVDCIVTSPPYWGLRDYGHADQIGLEDSPDAWCSRLVDVFRECRRVLCDRGTFWLNIGDAYASKGGQRTGGSHDGGVGRGDVPPARLSPDYVKAKDLIGLPWMLAFALRSDGWWLRSEIIWAKPNPMPESVKDRPTKAHEQVFLLAKCRRYFFDADAISEAHSREWWNERETRPGNADRADGGGVTVRRETPGRNIRSVWGIATQAFPEAHFATFPEELPRRCIAAGCPERVCMECGAYDDCRHDAWRQGVVLDPFLGSGTTLQVARRLNRRGIGIELNEGYAAIARARIDGEPIPQGKQLTIEDVIA